MKHIKFGADLTKVDVAVLIKESALFKSQLAANYIDSQIHDRCIAISLKYNEKNKCPAKLAKEYIESMLVIVKKMPITTLLVCDGNYFKFLTKNSKADVFYGHICPCAIKGYEHLNIILAPNYQAVVYNPAMEDKIDLAVRTLHLHLLGSYQVPGINIIKHEEYPKTRTEIDQFLQKLHQ
ncbi:unnamed protein product, partial [marine sediment metagenome]